MKPIKMITALHGPNKDIPWPTLTYAQQARSINATILYLKKAIAGHETLAIKKGKVPKKALLKCKKQFSDLVLWIENRISEK